MKRAVLRAAVEDHLRASGFGKGTWMWSDPSAELVLVFQTSIKRIKLPAARMSRCRLMFEMGRISGWADSLGLFVGLNGSHKSAPPAFELTPVPA